MFAWPRTRDGRTAWELRRLVRDGASWVARSAACGRRFGTARANGGNDEFPTTNVLSNEGLRGAVSPFVLRHSIGIRVSSFGICCQIAPAVNLHIAIRDVWLLGRNVNLSCLTATCGRYPSDCRGGYGHAQITDSIDRFLGDSSRFGLLHRPCSDISHRRAGHLLADPMRRCLWLSAGFARRAGCLWIRRRRRTDDIGAGRGSIAVTNPRYCNHAELRASTQSRTNSWHDTKRPKHLCAQHHRTGKHSAVGPIASAATRNTRSRWRRFAGRRREFELRRVSSEDAALDRRNAPDAA